jgi:hypothetical protein
MAMNKDFRRTLLAKIASDKGPGKSISNIKEEVKKKITLAKIVKDSGVLADFVRKKLDVKPSSFKEAFLKLKPGPEREQLVYDEVIKRKPLGMMVPITVPGPYGTEITYKVMSDFLTIDGMRVPMSGKTAQRIANHFGLSLPTSKITEQIWDSAGREGQQVAAKPLSGRGATIGGRRYSGKQIVERFISDSRAASAYNELMNKQISSKDKPLVAGHGKTIVMTDRPNQLGLYGGRDSRGNIIQNSEHTGHDIDIHTEYMTFGRFIAGDAEVKLPNGKTINTTMKKLLNHPEMHKAISKTKVKEYNV